MYAALLNTYIVQVADPSVISITSTSSTVKAGAASAITVTGVHQTRARRQIVDELAMTHDAGMQGSSQFSTEFNTKV